MAGFIHAIQFRSPTTTLKNSEDSSFPATNVNLLSKPHQPWKSSGNVVSGTTYVGADFGSAVTLGAIAIDNINLSSIKIQAAADSGFSTSLIDSGALTVGPFLPERGLFSDATGLPLARYKLFYNLAGTSFAAASRRYWRVLANTSTPITGAAGKMFVGSIAWCTAITTWGSGTSSYDETPLEATRTNEDFAGGGAEPVILGNGYCAITLGAAPGSRAALRAPMMELLRQGIGRYIVFYKNAGDTAEFIIGRRAADVTMSQRSPLTIETSSLIIQGAV
jgi:hypothetical protein